jgi:hypothetical protein
MRQQQTIGKKEIQENKKRKRGKRSQKQTNKQKIDAIVILLYFLTVDMDPKRLVGLEGGSSVSKRFMKRISRLTDR